MNDPKDLLTPKQSAEILGLSLSRVHKLAAAGRLGFKVGGRYIITRSELAKFKELPRPVGNPNFKKESKNENN